MRIDPQASFGFSRFSFLLFQHYIPWRIPSIPPATAFLNQRVIDVRAIGQDHVSKDALVPIFPVSLKRNFFPIGEGRGGLLRPLPIGLAFFMAVDAAETDTLRILVGRTSMVLPSRTETPGPVKSALARERTAKEGRRHSRCEDWLLSNESLLCSQIPISLGIWATTLSKSRWTVTGI